MEKYILLSIKPRIIKEIISGEKKFEFRKIFPNLNEPGSKIENTIIIYSSTPEMKIFGSFRPKTFIADNFENLMVKVNAAPAYRERISRYFTNKENCHAMEISDLRIYENPITLKQLREEHNNFGPGQSYRYIDKDSSIIKNIILKNGDI